MQQQTDRKQLTNLSAMEMAAKLRTKEICAVDLVRAHIEQIEQVNPSLNAVIHPLFVEAITAAERADRQLTKGTASGILLGVPMTIKDQYLLKGTPTSVGLAHLLDKPSNNEGPLVRRLREEGAVFLGKTNLPELCLTYECRHARFGAANNPWDNTRVPGGSSGGEAAIIASKGSPLGLGGDMGGSIRIPCHNCGISGLKPTHGRFPNDDSPLTPEVFGAFSGFEAYINQPGPMARHVDDLKLMMDALLARPLESTDPYPPVPWSVGPLSAPHDIRVGFYTEHPLFPPSSAVKRVVSEAVNGLREAGIETVPFDFPNPMRAYTLALALVSAAGPAWVKAALNGDPPTPTVKNLKAGMSVPKWLRPLLVGLLRATGQKISAELLKYSAPGSANDLQLLTAERTAIRADFVRAMHTQNVDVILCPPYALPAPTHNADVNGTVTAAGCYAMIYNLLGNPAGTVAASRVRSDETTGRPKSKDAVLETARKIDEGSEGLPVGVQVVGRHWQEEQVLSVMKVLETYFRSREGYPDFHGV